MRQRNIKLLLISVLFAVSGRVLADSLSAENSYPIATIAIHSSKLEIQNPNSDQPITALVFKNDGDQPIVVESVVIQILNGERIPSGMGFGVPAHGEISYLFSNNNPQKVLSIELEIQGTTESLTIEGLNRSGPVPGGFSTGN